MGIPDQGMTHSVAKMIVSQATWSEIADALREANYHHVFTPDGSIDMTGIALERDPVRSMPPNVIEIDATDLTRDAVRRIYQIDKIGTQQR
jgi:hypothetical protein